MGACPAIIILPLYKERGACPSFPGKHAISLKMRPRHCSFTLLLLFLFQSAIYIYVYLFSLLFSSFVHRWGKSSLSLYFFVLYFSLCSIQYLGDMHALLKKKKIRPSPRFLLPKFNSVQSIFFKFQHSPHLSVLYSLSYSFTSFTPVL